MQTKISTFCDKIIEIGWLAAVIVAPLFFNVYSFRTFEPDKIILVRSITGLMILAWAVSFFERVRIDSLLSVADHFRDWLKIPLFLPTLFLGLAYIISTIFSISPAVSLWGSYQRLQGTYSTLSYIAIFALTAGFLRSRQQVDRLMTTIIITSIPVSLYGMLQYFNFDPLPWAGDATRLVASSLGNATFLALYLMMIIPLTVSRLLESLVGVVKGEEVFWAHLILALVYALVFTLQMITLILTRSNGPLLGLLGAGLAMGLLIALRLRQLYRSWRWRWLGWFGLVIVTIGCVLAFNVWEAALALPTSTEGTSIQARQLIWDATLRLVAPHEPLGIAGDELAGTDDLNNIRPAVGYGPESMFNAFALVYPPQLAYVEPRGTSADRAHNETLDYLVTTGVLGLFAFYFLMINLFYSALGWLGWTPDRSSKWRLITLFLAGSLIGALTPSLMDRAGSPLTFTPLGLPLGLLAGMAIYLIWQGIIQQPEPGERVQVGGHSLLFIALVSALIGHFVAIHFIFSIAATYTYFWVYAGIITAIVSMKAPELALNRTLTLPEEEGTAKPIPVFESVDQSSTRFLGPEATPAAPASEPATESWLTHGENWLTWVGSQGLVMAVVLIILVFDFVSLPYYTLPAKRYLSLGAIFVVTWLVGLVLTLSHLPIHRVGWSSGTGCRQALLAAILYPVLSLSWAGFYGLIDWGFRAAANQTLPFVPQILLRQLSTAVQPDQGFDSAKVFIGSLLLFYAFLLLSSLLLAVALAWRQARGLALGRAYLLWPLYPVLTLAMSGAIWTTNINVARADIYLKVGEGFRNGQQWDEAIALHEKARSLDSHKDFYYLMLALDYQLMAQDTRLDQSQRQHAWEQGEKFALAARRVNPYNPDNTANLGRYYFTMGQDLDPKRFQDALTFLEKATILASSNVIYYNLWAQTYYFLQDYEMAVDRLQTSISIDNRYSPSWILLGDVYATLGKVDEALKAHSQAMQLDVSGSDGFLAFADQSIDQRLDFYVSAGRSEDIIAAMRQVAQERPDNAHIQWAIGHAYHLDGKPEHALSHLEQARALGDNSDRTVRELADTYLHLNRLEEALADYELIVRRNPTDVQAHSSLAYIYARQGRLDAAVQANKRVVQQLPNDYNSWRNLAILYKQLQEWSEALSAARRARDLAPPDDLDDWDQFIDDVDSRLAP